MTGVRRGVLVVTRNLPPLRGGMERLVHRLCRELAADFDLGVVGPKGCETFLPAVRVHASLPHAPLFRFLLAAQWQTLGLARKMRPGLILAGSGLTAPAVVVAGRAAQCPVAGYLHGLDVVVEHPLYRIAFLPAIRSLDHVLVNSRHTASLAQAAGVAADRIQVLHPGVSLPDLPLPDSADLRQRYGLGAGPLLLSVGRLTPRKGIVEFVRHCLPRITREVPEVRLVVIGGEARDAARASPVTASTILDAAHDSGVRQHVVLTGTVDDRTLARFYAAGRVLVFPVVERRGDVEGFGMVALEAAAHGIPTVAFRVGGAQDAVQDGVSGTLVAPGDYAQMADVLVGTITKAPSQADFANCRSHAEQFSWERFGASLRSSCHAWIGAG